MGQVSYVRVPSDKMSPERLDIGFYSKEYFEALSILESSNINTVEIGDVTEPWCFGAYALCNSIVWSNSNEGLPYIKAEALSSPLINFDGLTYITKGTHKLLTKSQLKAGDIIVSISGTIGLCAVIPDSIEIANSNQDTIKFNPSKKGFDNYFVVAWIASRYGQIILKREAGGAIQQHIYLSNFRRIPLLNPDHLVQNYIGDKVRMAEKLRERSKHIESEIENFFIFINKDLQQVGQYRSYRTNPSVLNPKRLDTLFYDPAYLHLQEVLDKNNAIHISKSAIHVKKTWNKQSEQFYYLEIGAIDLANGSITLHKLFTKDAPSRAKLLVQPWDILVSTVRPNRKNIALVPEVADDIPIVASTGFSVLRFKSKEAAVFYHSWLRSDAGTQQLMRWNAGGSYPAIDDSVAISTLIPYYKDDVIEKQGKLWLMKFIGQKLSKKLTIAAKFLVEALIEGKLTETELKEAQTALQKGDIEPDKAILAKFTRQGYDIPDEPAIFLYLDALYE